ncbi:hypothetical protein K431DRAFT_284314 [Polychaeton citri CBS 116435]|uniref:Uncharacterized protein n=1 Tax=Polychaeton citri CBS 116435 TaxID=1314669 RepID=A0A9P4UQS9_9PEZI|nr:hypothetical protein K431DRAFT_284314 [Polychaeton citri CBS 116435]
MPPSTTANGHDTKAVSSTTLPGMRSTPSESTLAKRQSTRSPAMTTPPSGTKNNSENDEIETLNTPDLFTSLSRSTFRPLEGSPTPIRHPTGQGSSMYSRENLAPAAPGNRPPPSQQQNRRPLITPRPAPVARSQVFNRTSILNDRFQETPSLPSVWSSAHDRAICVLDARNYSLSAIVIKMRRTFPELEGVTLTPAMVDKRLRILDQRVELDYWAVGLRGQGGSGGYGGRERV